MKKKKTIILIASIAGAVVLTVSLLTAFVFVPMSKYSKAMEHYNNGDYASAKETFTEIDNWKDAKQQLQIIAAHEYFADENVEEGISAICGINGNVTVTYQLANGNTDVVEMLNSEDPSLYSDFTKTGYHFSDWDIIEYTIDNTENNYSATITIKAIWAPNPDTQYVVNHYLENYENNEYMLAESLSLQGETDSTVTAEQKEFEGYVFPAVETVTIAPDGTSVVNYYYARRSISLTFETNGGAAVNDLETKWGTPLSDLPSCEKVGYTFGGWFTDVSLTAQNEVFTDNATLYAKWIPNTDTNYVVNYYLKNYDEDSYTLKESVQLQGVTDSTVETEVKTYEGFVSPERQTVTILPDGSAVLEYYYAREIIALSFVSNGGESIDTFVTEWGTPTADVPVCERNGYTFGGWFTDVSLTAQNEVYTSDVTLYAYWSEEYKPTEFTYSLNEDTYTLIGTTLGNMEKLLPVYIGGRALTAIAENALSDIIATKLIIPNTVVNIETNAFASADLSQIVLSNSVKAIGASAFDNCDNLNSVYYDGSIADWCSISFADALSNPMACAERFYIDNTEVVELTIPNGVSDLGAYQFYGFENVKNIVVPDSVKKIANDVFTGCNAVATLNVPFIGSSDEELDNAYLGYFFGGNSYALNAKFVPQSLNKLVITNSVAIDDYALYGLPSLTEIELPETLLKIGNYAFMNTSVTYIEIPDSVTEIGFGALKYCDKLNYVKLPFVGGLFDNVNDGENEHFGVIFGAKDSSENNGYVPASLAIVEITNATEIDSYAFSGCVNIQEIILPKTLLSIESNAFYGCTGLRFIHIPTSVEKMFANVFDSCTNMVIYCEATEIQSGWEADWNASDMPVYYGINESTFVEADGLQYVVQNGNAVLSKCVSEAKNVIVPSTVAIGDTDYSVTAIGREAFAECSHLRSVTLSDTIELVTDSAFYNCSALASITLNGNIKEIGNSVFYNCTALTEIELNDGLMSIGASAFRNCPMDEIFIPNTVATIGQYAFTDCANVVVYCEATEAQAGWNTNWNSSNRPVYYNVNDNTFIELDGVQYVIENGTATVANCVSNEAAVTVVNSVMIGENTYDVTTIGSYAFENCDNLTNLSLPTTLTTIESYAVTNCNNLTTVVVPENVTSIATRAFYNCSNLTIYCYCSQQEARQQWGNNWYYGCRVSYNYSA